MDSVGRATKPACEPRLMMRPRFCRIITRPAAWLAKNVPFRLTARVRSKSFSRTFSAGVTRAAWPFTSKRGKSSLFMGGVLSSLCAFYAQPKDRERRSATWSSGLIRQGGPPWVEHDRTGAVVEVDALEEAGRQQTVLG